LRQFASQGENSTPLGTVHISTKLWIKGGFSGAKRITMVLLIIICLILGLDEYSLEISMSFEGTLSDDPSCQAEECRITQCEIH